MACNHKTHVDHKDENGLWVCSVCGKAGRWREGWSYYGNVECGRCQTAEIDRVFCSPECAAKDGE